MRIAVAGATGRVGRHIVDVVEENGHEAVPMSRRTGVDVVTGDGLAGALAGVEWIIDAATGPSPDEQEAAAFFTAASRNLQQAGERAGVRGIVMVSIIGIDRLEGGGYYKAKLQHERDMLAGPLPVRILRAAQFHEFVDQLMAWGRQGDVVYVPKMRTQPVAARNVAEALVGLVTTGQDGSTVEIAGPREENLADLARLFATRRGDPVKIEEVSNPADPMTTAYESGVLLPGPDAIIAGPTFQEWLSSNQ
jgi:uncharacterized protein YbjT (DUF2867 family)